MLIFGNVLLPGTYLQAFGLHMLIVSIACAFLWRGNWQTLANDLGLNLPLKDVIKYVGLGMLLLVVGAVIAGLSVKLLFPAAENTTPQVIQKLPWYVLLFAVAVGPVTEEIFFRGLLCKRFGILPSAIVFGLVHLTYGSIYQVVGTFTIGLVLGYLFSKSQSIVPGILVHSAYNLFSIVIVLLLF